MEQCDVSVIMGLYNTESTIAEAIDSLLHQTYKNWKLIICDDGSTDGSYAVAKQYADQYDNIILLKSERNHGPAHASNRCLELVDTKYVAKMDSDDISLPERLEKQVTFLKEHPEYDFVSSDIIYFDEGGDWAQRRSKEIPTKEDMAFSTPFCHGCCMITAEAYRAVGGYTVHPLTCRVEDYHLWAKLFAHGFKGYNIQQPLYRIRETRNAFHKRKYRYRINEAYVHFYAFRTLHLPLYSLIYTVRPLIVGLMPMWLYARVHRWKLIRSCSRPNT